jgi:hypothetical protein
MPVSRRGGGVASFDSRSGATTLAEADLDRVRNLVARTTSYTAADGDYAVCDTTSGAITVTLPAAVAGGYVVAENRTGVSTVTVHNLLGGDVVLTGSHAGALCFSDGTNWHAIVIEGTGAYVPAVKGKEVFGVARFHGPLEVVDSAHYLDPHQFRSRNADTYLNIPSFDGSGALVEPSVMYFPGGYRNPTTGAVVTINGLPVLCVMIVAGYLSGNSFYENPQIRVSPDPPGYVPQGLAAARWYAMTGAPDPILPNEGGGVHNADQALMEDQDGSLVFTVFRTDGATYQDFLAFRTVDLVNFTALDGTTGPTVLGTNANYANWFVQTPIARWDADLGQYRVWAFQTVPAAGNSGMLHNAGATLAAAFAPLCTANGVAYAGGVCTTNLPVAGQQDQFWEGTVKRVGSMWVALCSVAQGGSASVIYLHLGVSTDGLTWDFQQAPLIRSQLHNGPEMWDAGMIYRADFVPLLTARGGLKLAIWYSAPDVATNWRVGYTEAWQADAEAPRHGLWIPDNPSQWYPNPLAQSATTVTPTINTLYLWLFDTGEDGIWIDELGDINVTAAGSGDCVARMGIYRIIGQAHPYQYTISSAFARLVAECATQTSLAATGRKTAAAFTGGASIWCPPRTKHAIAAVQQGTTAATVSCGQGNAGQFAPFGATQSYGGTHMQVALIETGVSGALPGLFSPAGTAFTDTGVGLHTASSTVKY